MQRGATECGVWGARRVVCGRKEPSSKGRSLMPRFLMPEASVAGGEEGEVEGLCWGVRSER